MTTNRREFVESPMPQGKDEKIRYNLTTTNWGGSPSSPVVKIYDEAGNDLSSTLLDGTASITGDVITTPFIQSLINGKRYRVEVQFTSGGNTLEVYGYIKAEQ